VEKVCNECGNSFVVEFAHEDVTEWVCDDCFINLFKPDEKQQLMRSKRYKLIKEQEQWTQNLYDSIGEIEKWTKAHREALEAISELNYLIGLDDNELNYQLKKRVEEAKAVESSGVSVDDIDSLF
jgi:hypothetical protein